VAAMLLLYSLQKKFHILQGYITSKTHKNSALSDTNVACTKQVLTAAMLVLFMARGKKWGK
jgi:hypothetical protein